MANMIKFGEHESNKKPFCHACEEMLTDALDGTLSAADQAWFEAHIASCVTCSDTYADAQRGAAWLEMLKSPRPEPSATLIDRIMAQTSGSSINSHQVEESDYSGDVWNTGATPFLVPTPVAMPSSAHIVSGNVLPFRPRPSALRSFGRVLLEPRLAMTAAMAFFSIALTLNLVGIRLNDLHASDLRPDNLRRSFYTTNAQAVRYFDSLRVVHVMESRVEDLRQQNEDRELMRKETPAPHLETKPEEKAPKKSEPGTGTSRRETPATPDKPRYVLTDAAMNREDYTTGKFWNGTSTALKGTGGWA
jgi:hypothetical protein